MTARKKVLILGVHAAAVAGFATRHAESLGVTGPDQVVALTDARQLRGRRGERLIVLEDCYTHRLGGAELWREAKALGLEIVYRSCLEDPR